MEKKNSGHFEKRAAIGRRNTPHHSYTNGSKEVPACVRNSDYGNGVLHALIFGNISSACTKKICNCCNVLMLVEVEVRKPRWNNGGYLRDYGRSGRHF